MKKRNGDGYQVLNDTVKMGVYVRTFSVFLALR